MNPTRPYHDLSGGTGSGGLLGMVRAWERFWFRPADPLPLGVIRIFAGLVILYVHLIYSLDLLALVGPKAWLNQETIDYFRKEVLFFRAPMSWDGSDETYTKGQPIWSVWFHLEDPGWIVTTHIAFLTAMFMFTIGLGTKVTGVVTWVGAVSYINRLPVFLYGIDTMMNITIIYLTIGPSGAALSVDRLIAKWWAKRNGEPEPEVEPRVAANFALRLMQVHFCIIYMASGLSKLQGSAWWNGTAVWGTLANYQFAPMNWPVYVDFLRLLCRNRLLWELIMTVGTFGTLVLEISFPFLIWNKNLRWLMICGSVAMHTGIGLIMGLTTFSLFMMCLVMSFIPAATHHAFVAMILAKGRGVNAFLKAKTPPPGQNLSPTTSITASA